MAMKDILPSSTTPDSSPSRRCCYSVRFSPCLFVVGFIFFFLLFQFDVVPQIDFQKIRNWQFEVSRYLKTLSSSSSSSSTTTAQTYTSHQPPHTVESTHPVAICLVGGARAFELTGPSIKKYLLQALPNSDVFLHAPLDHDAYKLSLLKDAPNIVHVRIFSPKAIPTNKIYTDVLTASNSPHGIQGLLQYFNLVEGCFNMIKQYQMHHNFTYKWIIRTRLDGYWAHPLPPLEKLDPTAYTIPVGSKFGGLNDRLGIGTWKTSEAALTRLSLIPVLHAHGARGLNSETSFKTQLEVKNVPHREMDFPFCILSHRRYGWPPGHYGVPVLSISSKGNLNGAKCRPCNPVSKGSSAKAIIDAQEKSWCWPGHIKGPELCDPTHDWERNWEAIFDRVAGPTKAKVRKMVSNMTMSDCVEAYGRWKRDVREWDSPLPEAICEQSLGKST